MYECFSGVYSVEGELCLDFLPVPLRLLATLKMKCVCTSAGLSFRTVVGCLSVAGNVTGYRKGKAQKLRPWLL